MKLPQLSLRELFWLILVVALALGWWLDRDHIRLQMESLKTSQQQFANERERFWQGAKLLTEVQVLVAEEELKARNLELNTAAEANRTTPGIIPQSELNRLKATANTARLNLEKLRATMEFSRTASNNAGATVPTPVSLAP